MSFPSLRSRRFDRTRDERQEGGTLRRLIASEMGTVDGFFAGPNGELDWFVQDEELDKFANVLSLSTRFCTDGHLPEDGRLLAARTRKLCRQTQDVGELVE